MLRIPSNEMFRPQQFEKKGSYRELADVGTRNYIDRITKDLNAESIQEALIKLKQENDKLHTKLDEYEPQVKKYRKKPVVIEAVRYQNQWQLHRAFPDIKISIWLKGTQTVVILDTLEGKMEISEWDYIIKGIKGEYYPCKPDIFEETYERV